MYVYEKKALKRCSHVLMKDLNINSTFLSQLEKENVITRSHISQILDEPTRTGKITMLLDILYNQEDGACLRLINVLKTDYPWISCHLQREFIKEKTLFNKDFNQDLTDVVNDKISPMVLGPEAEKCCAPKTSKDSLACVDTISDLLKNLQTLSYRHLNVDPVQVCNMALCVVLEEKIVKYKKTIENLQETITKLKVPINSIRVLKQEILNEKEAAKRLEKQNMIKDAAVSHLQCQNALLKQKLDSLLKSNDCVCALCNGHCIRERSYCK